MKKLSQKEMKAVKGGGGICPMYFACGANASGGGYAYCLDYPGDGSSGGSSGYGTGSGGYTYNCTYSPPYVPPGGSPGPGY